MGRLARSFLRENKDWKGSAGGQAPSGAELKKHRSPFVLERRKRYGIPVPDYGLTLGHEPGERRPIHRAPGFSELVVETEKEH